MRVRSRRTGLHGGALARLFLVTALIAAGGWGPPVVWAQDATLTYKVYCSRCHGETGRGDGADAATLKTRPRDFTDCATMSKISDDTMFTAIKEGGAAVGLPADMPSWAAGLSDDDIHALMKYIRHFCQK
jgi:cytochrome c oxidase cbb3-type subunit III